MNNQTIQSFYDSEFKKFLSKNSLRAFINGHDQEAVFRMNRLWEKNNYSWGDPIEMDDDLIDLIIKRMSPLYQEFEKKMNLILKQIFVLNSDDLQGEGLDFIVLNNIRVIKKQDQLVPNFYFRKNPDSNKMGSLKRSWVQVSNAQFKRVEVLQSQYKLADTRENKQVQVLLRHIFFLVTWLHLSSDNEREYRYLSGIAEYEWAKRKLSGKSQRGDEFVTAYDYGDSKSYYDEKRARHIAGLLGYLYLRKNNKDEVEQTVTTARKQIGDYLDKCFTPHKFQYLEELALKRDMAYFKLCFCEYIEQHQERLEFWSKDSVNKLLYLNYFEYDRKENILKNVDSDYFSYDKMIIGGSKCTGAYKFPSKRAMRRAFTMNQEIFIELLPLGIDDFHPELPATDIVAKQKRNFWRNMVLWLDYVRHPENIDLQAIRRAKPYITALFIDNNSEKMSKQIPVLVDLIYLYFVNKKENLGGSAEVNDLLDYMHGNVYEFKKNGEIVKSRHKNAYLLNKTSTLNSLQRKSDAWHRDVGLYNQVEMLRKGEEYKEQVYTKLNDLVIDRGGFVFTLIKNHYDLLMEGVEMHHCVETYHKRITKGQYAVFSVLRKDSDSLDRANRFTLGIHLNDDSIRLDQCKGVYNAKISAELKEVVDELIIAINQGEFEIKEVDSKEAA